MNKPDDVHIAELVDLLDRTAEVIADMRELAESGDDALGFVEAAEDAHQLLAKAMTHAMRPMLLKQQAAHRSA